MSTSSSRVTVLGTVVTFVVGSAFAKQMLEAGLDAVTYSHIMTGWLAVVLALFCAWKTGRSRRTRQSLPTCALSTWPARLRASMSVFLTSARGEGLLDGQPASAEREGLGDRRFRLS